MEWARCIAESRGDNKVDVLIDKYDKAVELEYDVINE
jgi:hypothetical protein